MDLKLKDKVALVTGAGSQVGFGRGIAVTLAAEGCHVVVADLDLEGAQKTAAEIQALKREALAVKVDVTSRAEIKAMVDQALARFGKIDILVNNAGGVASLKSFDERPESDLDKDIDLNLRAVMNCCKAVIDHMISRKSGKIINISSIGSKKAMPHVASYNAAKAGVVGFSQALAVEVAPLGINVNCIAPGLGLTNFAGGPPPPEALKQTIARIPARRTTQPEDIANTVAFLASDVSSDIVGQNISVDGGDSIT
jgi:NAD(P)-dependent dehydrogenase (short-subunit alcohol dehydrogenase family)